MKTKFRPFWSFRVESTEQWLQKMSEEGYKLISIFRLFSLFRFQKVEQPSKIYRLLYKTPYISPYMTTIGWELKKIAPNWFLASNNCASPAYFPSEEKLLRRSAIYQVLITTLFFISTILFFYLFITRELPIAINILLILATISLLIGSIFFPVAYSKLEKRELLIVQEKEEIEDFSKFKASWFHFPFQTEKWLNKMERDGYRLIKVNSIFFFFKKKDEQTKRIAYKVVLNFRASKSYFSIYQEEGWRVKYIRGSIFRIIIWAKEYEGLEVPKFFPNTNEEKKMITTYILQLALAYITIIITCLLVLLLFKTNTTSFLELLSPMLLIILVFTFVIGKAIWQLVRFRSTIGMNRTVKKSRHIFSAIYIGASILLIYFSSNFHSYITPYQFKQNLVVSDISVVLTTEELIHMKPVEEAILIEPTEELIQIIKDITIGSNVSTVDADITSDEKDYIRFYFMESGRHYLFYKNSNENYYFTYQYGNAYIQHNVKNGKQLHERLLFYLEK